MVDRDLAVYTGLKKKIFCCGKFAIGIFLPPTTRVFYVGITLVYWLKRSKSSFLQQLQSLVYPLASLS